MEAYCDAMIGSCCGLSQIAILSKVLGAFFSILIVWALTAVLLFQAIDEIAHAYTPCKK